MAIDHAFPPSEDSLITVADCGERLKVLRDVIVQLEKAGVRVPRYGRLRKAIGIIEQAETSAAHPTTKRDQLAFAQAMSEAAEFFDIGHIVPAQLTSQLAGELRLLMKGPSGQPHVNSQSQRFQSQFWLGTILHRGGCQPRFTGETGNRAPDYLIEEGTLTYGAEIKRPDKAESAETAVMDAAKQLRDYGVKGTVLLDLTSAARLGEMAWVTRSEGADAAKAAKGRFLAITRPLGAAIKQEYYQNSSSPLRSILYVFYVARTFSWIEGSPSGLTFVALAAGGAFVRPLKNLEYHHTINIAERINVGLRHAGFPFELFRQVARPPEGFPFTWKV